VRKVPKLETADQSQEINQKTTFRQLSRTASSSPSKISRVSVIKLPRNKVPETQQAHFIDASLHEQGKKQQNEGIFFNVKSGPDEIVNIGDRRSRKPSVGNVSVLGVKRSSIVKPMADTRKSSIFQAGSGINSGMD
jgi:hypothetical protein